MNLFQVWRGLEPLRASLRVQLIQSKGGETFVEGYLQSEIVEARDDLAEAAGNDLCPDPRYPLLNVVLDLVQGRRTSAPPV